MGCVYAYVIILALVGPENLGRKFGVAHDSDMYDAAGEDALAAVVHRREAMGRVADPNSDEEEGKGAGVRREKEVMA